MGKKVLILSASPRRNGNCSLLCQEFLRGAKDSGNQVEYIFLRDKKIGYCTACRYCKSHDGKCVQDDDMNEINLKMLAADVLVLASPIYYFTVNGQMKTLIDRTFGLFNRMEHKEMYYIMTSADVTDDVMDTALATFRWFAHFLPGSVEKGILRAKGFGEAGAVKEHPVMQEAYNLGASA